MYFQVGEVQEVRLASYTAIIYNLARQQIIYFGMAKIAANQLNPI